MTLPANIDTTDATLPANYERAVLALEECAEVDACKEWADKAAALASYAKQCHDEELDRLAARIRGRAWRRMGELMKQIEPSKGGRPSAETKAAADPSLTRKEAAKNAGLSERQTKTAIRVANVPKETFDAMIEADKPATITDIAAIGTAKRMKEVYAGRSRDEYILTVQVLRGVEGAANDLEALDVETAIPLLTDQERDRLRVQISRLDRIADHIATRF